MNNLKALTTHERILTRSKFRELTGISRTTEWRLSIAGKLPTQISVDGRTLGYLESAYQDWLEENSRNLGV